jgi:hypothetical protein
MNEGANLIWKRLIVLNPSTSATGAQLQGMSSGTAGLAVGISTAAVAATQTDLQAATGTTARWIKGMQAAYPSHSTANPASSSGARETQFRAQYTTTEANFAWEEWALFNDPNSTGVNAAYALGAMLNRKLQSLGTKTTSATWTATMTLSIS